jgi:short-subunit dehydrogenase
MAAETGDRPLALITGASGGIGEAFAHVLAAEGYGLVLAARRTSELNRVAGVVTSRHDVPVTVIDADLSHEGAGARLKAQLDARGLRPDVLINNAGWGLNRRVLEAPVEDQLNIIDLNIRALTDLTIRFLPAMKERGRGGVLNLGSMAAFMPGPTMAVYYASKAYVVSFTEAVAHELRGTGVTVSVYCPGPVLTGFQRRAGMSEARLVRMLRPISAEACARAGWDAFKKGQVVTFPRGVDAMGAFFERVTPRAVTFAALEFFHKPSER